MQPTSAILGHQIVGKDASGFGYTTYLPLELVEHHANGDIWLAIPRGDNLAEKASVVHLVLQIGDPIPDPK